MTSVWIRCGAFEDAFESGATAALLRLAGYRVQGRTDAAALTR